MASLAFASSNAQITNSLSIDVSDIREYDGSYEQIGWGHFFYPNEHETRLNDEANNSAIDYVSYYTLNTHPKKYLLRNNNICFNFAKRDTSTSTVTDSLHRIDVEMYRSNAAAFLARVDTQNTAVLNYFNQWYGATGRTNVKGGAAIACQSIWPNIDLVYTSNNRGLKMYFIVYPGGNPKDVMLHIKGSRANGISGSNLNFYSNWDGSSFIKPRMYQYTISGSVVTPVTVCNANWQSLGSDIYGISTTSSYISSLPLIIEVMEGVASTAALTGIDWSTYIGGTMQDLIYKAKSDASNNLFTSGSTNSINFPVNAGPSVATNNIGTAVTTIFTSNGFIAKFNPSGVLQWVTNVGGSNAEEIYDFDFKGGSYYCVGRTASNNMPVQSKTGAYNDASYNGTNDRDGFVFQLSGNGQTNTWLTYFGGNKADEFSACKFDGTGAFFVVGFSQSTNLSPFGAAGSYTQTYNAAQLLSTQDAIILKFNATSDTLNWFTFYGTDAITSNWPRADDQFFGIDIDGTDIYACGFAGGTNLPSSNNSKMLPGFYDGILTKFTTAGAIVTAKYTNGNAWNRSVKVNNGRIYTAGLAQFGMTLKNSGSYYYDPICTLSDEDACFSVHNLNLDTTFHCTYLGEAGGDEANDLQFGTNGVFYIAGHTQATWYPVVSTISGMYTSALTGIQNYFVSAFRQNDTNMVWSTCVGSQDVEGFGNQNENRHCTTIALDGQGFMHLCGVTKSFTMYPLANPGGGTYFQAFSASNPTNNATWNGTITRFNLAPLNTWVGIKEMMASTASVRLYPNPTSNYLSIDDPTLQGQNLQYAIYDLAGRKWSDGKANAGKQKNIDVSALPHGVYLITFSSSTRTYNGKFVKVGG